MKFHPSIDLPSTLRIGIQVLLIIPFLFSFCNELRAEQAPSQIGRQRIETRADLDHLLKPGLTTNQIVALLGKPDGSKSLDSSMRWTYIISPPLTESGASTLRVTAADLFIKEGRLVSVGLVSFGSHDEAPSSRGGTIVELLNESNTNQSSPALKLFVVSQNPTPGGRYIDSTNLPRLGYIPSTPILAIYKLKRVTMEESPLSGSVNSNRSNFIFDLTLNSEDARRCESITEKNVGSTLLVTQGEDPIIAVDLKEPISTGVIRVSLTDRLRAEEFKKAFESKR